MPEAARVWHPAVSVISVGAKNTFGHPSRNVIASVERLQLVVPQTLLAQYPAVEVLLETPRHFAGFEDQRMKSYALQAAAIE